MRQATAVLAAAVSIVGCGGSGADGGGPERTDPAVRQAIETFYAAFAAGDGKPACRHMTRALRVRMIEAAEASSCPEAVDRAGELIPRELREKLAEARVEQVLVSGDRATAFIVGDDTYASEPPESRASLEVSDGEWALAELPRIHQRDRVTICFVDGMRSFEEGDVGAFWKSEGRADFAEFLIRTCKRADREGGLGTSTSEATREAVLEDVSADVQREMIRSGRIAGP